MQGNNNMGQNQAPVAHAPPFNFSSAAAAPAVRLNDTGSAFYQQARRNDPDFNDAEAYFASQGHSFPSMAAAQALQRQRYGGKSKRSSRRSTKRNANKSKRSSRRSKSRQNGGKSKRSSRRSKSRCNRK